MFTEKEFDDFWASWSNEEEKNYQILDKGKDKGRKKYLKKGYTHFDHRFWFPDRKDELKVILQNGLRLEKGHNGKNHWWAFSPFLKILLKTPRYKYQAVEGHHDLETKIRPICFASHIDSLIFGFYAHALTRKYELYIENEGFSDCPLAYRSNLEGKCNIQFAKEVFDEIKIRKTCTAIAIDIKGYFDNIDHIILKEKWSKVIGEKNQKLPDEQYKLFKTLTQYSYVNKNSILKKYEIDLENLPRSPQTLLELIPGDKDFEKFQRLRNDRLIVTNNQPNSRTNRHCGIPQGSAMSALLSNIYLIDFDREINERAKKEGFFYRRYCDDLLVICETDKAKQLQKDIIKKFEDEYFLEIQQKKVELTEFRANSKNKIRAFNLKKQLKDKHLVTNANTEKYYYKSLQYLGFEFNGQDIFIRSSSLSRYFRKMTRRIIKSVVMAYSPNGKDDKIWKKQIYERYTHLGNRNFLSYAYNSSKEYYTNSEDVQREGMNSPAIRKQLARHIHLLDRKLNTKNNSRFLEKESKNKAKKKKKV